MQNIHWSPNLRRKSAGNFLNLLNSGFKYFLREGKFRDRARTDFIVLGRRQKAKGHLTLTYSFDQLFPRILYKRGTYFLKRGKHKGGIHSFVIFYCPFSKNEWIDFLLRTGMQNKGGAIWRRGCKIGGVPSGEFFENEQTGEKSHVATMLLWETGGFKYYWGVLRYH